MPSLYYFSCFIGGSLIIANTAIASLIPSHVSGDIANKHKARALEFYVDCSDDQKTKLGQGFADAATLARWVFDQPIDLASTAYTHYLRPEDETIAKSLWNAIQQYNDPKIDPANTPIQFSVRCSAGGDECPAGSLAITDSTPRSSPEVAEMLICPFFFTAPETAQNLGSKEIIQNPSRRQNSWCQPGPKFSDFETAGHTLLHEMTHLDSAGAAAGLSERDGTHGTDDVGGLGDRYQQAARALKNLWDGTPADGTLTPVENAENIAAAATEWYFLNNCGFDEIAS